MSTEQLYWSSELHCAYFALRVLEEKLNDTEEWGTTIFRWPDPSGGWRYSFQRPVYKGNNGNFWRPLGRIPNGTRIWAHCHSHPGGGYFSKQDTSWARGEHGIDPDRPKFVIYMVNSSGAYFYDGTRDFAEHEQRFGVVWQN